MKRVAQLALQPTRVHLLLGFLCSQLCSARFRKRGRISELQVAIVFKFHGRGVAAKRGGRGDEWSRGKTGNRTPPPSGHKFLSADDLNKAPAPARVRGAPGLAAKNERRMCAHEPSPITNLSGLRFSDQRLHYLSFIDTKYSEQRLSVRSFLKR